MAEGDEDLQEKSLLKSMGVEDYEPRVIHQFLELWYRYVVDVLTDALVYSEHAGKPAIDCDDVKLAIQSKVNSSFSQPPPREVLLELARNRNKAPLPKSIARPGIPLPPEQDTLIKPNYQLAISNLPKQLKKWRRMKKVVLILTHHKNRRQICHNILLKEWPSPSQNVPSESFMIERADGSIGFK